VDVRVGVGVLVAVGESDAVGENVAVGVEVAAGAAGGAAGAAGSLLFLQAKTPATAMMNKEPRMIRFTGCLRSRMVRILPSPPREPYPNRRGHRKRVSDR